MDIKLRLCRLQTEPAPCPNFGTVGGETRDDIQFQYTDKNGNNQILTPDAANQFTVRFFADQDPVINAIAKNDDDLEGIEQFSLIVYDADVSASIQNFFNIIEDKRNRLLVRIPANDGTIEIGAQEVPANAEGFNCTTAGGLSLDGPYTGGNAFEVEEVASGDGNKVAIVVELDPVVPAGGITLPFALTATPASGGYKLNTNEYDITIPEMCNPEGGTIVTNKDHEKINSGAPINKRNIVKQNEDELEIFIPWRTERFVILVEVSPDTFADAEETLEVEAENLSNFYRTKTAGNEKVEIVIPENDNVMLFASDIVQTTSVNGNIKTDQFGVRVTRTGGNSQEEVIAIQMQKRLKGEADYEVLDINDVSPPAGTGATLYREKVLSADEKSLYLLFPYPAQAVAGDNLFVFSLEDPNGSEANQKPFDLTFTVLDDDGTALGDPGPPSTLKTNAASPYKADDEKENREQTITVTPFRDFFSMSVAKSEQAEPASGTADVAVTLKIAAGATLPQNFQVRITPAGESTTTFEGTDFDIVTSNYDSAKNIITFRDSDFTTLPSGAQSASFIHRVKADNFAEPDETAGYQGQFIAGTQQLAFSNNASVTINTPANDNDMTFTLKKGTTPVAGNSETIIESSIGSGIDYTLTVTLDHPLENDGNGNTVYPKMLFLIGENPALTRSNVGQGARQNVDYQLGTVTGAALAATTNNRHRLTFNTQGLNNGPQATIAFKMLNESGTNREDSVDEVFRIKPARSQIKSENIYVLDSASSEVAIYITDDEP